LVAVLQRHYQSKMNIEPIFIFLADRAGLCQPAAATGNILGREGLPFA
jgi:hypothetical protein